MTEQISGGINPKKNIKLFLDALDFFRIVDYF